MESNPKELKPFVVSFRMKQKMEDERDWRMGLYMTSAVTYAVDHCLNGKKAKTRYLEEPLLHDMETLELTEEERNERELRKMLLAEEMWIQQAHLKGLPNPDEF